eukprot:CAMPEP_0204645422 /NCGR_PEP_ID=MMETSP0718-20130828/2778_1 /ASSEMBLY_ACC=CAM_ASM_000674 /TAXON_ID=230516 /ORGANISM="Chaetoceros curvisetus" /LENGTH=77 /DNA_ID=CAMNT_0051667349 /DNA_START=243 /DNA_END=476 /DNA_ORIENTATION=-
MANNLGGESTKKSLTLIGRLTKSGDLLSVAHHGKRGTIGSTSNGRSSERAGSECRDSSNQAGKKQNYAHDKFLDSCV